MNGTMTSARSTVAMITGILTMRFHALLNDYYIDEMAWWIIMFPAVICLRILIGAVSGEDW